MFEIVASLAKIMLSVIVVRSCLTLTLMILKSMWRFLLTSD